MSIGELGGAILPDMLREGPGFRGVYSSMFIGELRGVGGCLLPVMVLEAPGITGVETSIG